MATLTERFEQFVEPVPECGCWIWTGALRNKRYGNFWLAGMAVRAHRVAVELYHGVQLDPEQVVIHECDTPLCVNPAHLRVGTQSENMKDCYAKGRSPLNRPPAWLPDDPPFTPEQFDRVFGPNWRLY